MLNCTTACPAGCLRGLVHEHRLERRGQAREDAAARRRQRREHHLGLRREGQLQVLARLRARSPARSGLGAAPGSRAHIQGLGQLQVLAPPARAQPRTFRAWGGSRFSRAHAGSGTAPGSRAPVRAQPRAFRAWGGSRFSRAHSGSGTAPGSRAPALAQPRTFRAWAMKAHPAKHLPGQSPGPPAETHQAFTAGTNVVSTFTLNTLWYAPPAAAPHEA
jgi:hypothetical protein